MGKRRPGKGYPPLPGPERPSPDSRNAAERSVSSATLLLHLHVIAGGVERLDQLLRVEFAGDVKRVAPCPRRVAGHARDFAHGRVDRAGARATTVVDAD